MLQDMEQGGLDCRVCGTTLASTREWLLPPSALVGSDCTAWPGPSASFRQCSCSHVSKWANSNYLSSIDELYRNYQPHSQGRGIEQQIWTRNGSAYHAVNRSSAIVDLLFSLNILPQANSFLDYGAGTAPFLRSLPADLLESAFVAAADIGSHLREVVAGIPGVNQFFDLGKDVISDKFDVISLIHVIEHVHEPRQLLKSMTDRLTSKGVLVIQTPYYASNPFDLCIADHLSHFTKRSLQAVAHQSGLEILWGPSELIHRELTMLCQLPQVTRHNATPDGQHHPGEVFPYLSAPFNFLENWIYQLSAEELESCQNLRIFGSSIGASCTKSICDARGLTVSGFLDQDANRVGATFRGLPITDTSDGSLLGATVLVPLVSTVLEKVLQDLSPLKISVIVPGTSSSYVHEESEPTFGK